MKIIEVGYMGIVYINVAGQNCEIELLGLIQSYFLTQNLGFTVGIL